MLIRRVLITRPREDAAGLAAILRQRGIDTISEPLLDIHMLPLPALDLEDVQALLVTSLNGVRALAAATPRRALKLLTVGDATAALARNLGFTDVASAAGDARALAGKVMRDLNPAAGALVHVSGKTVAGNLAEELEAAGFTCRRATLYEARAATALSPGCLAALRQEALDAVLFFSPRTAATFVRLAEAATVAGCCARLTAVCLSDATAAAAAALPWHRIAIAAEPNQAALLTRLQQEVDGG